MIIFFFQIHTKQEFPHKDRTAIKSFRFAGKVQRQRNLRGRKTDRDDVVDGSYRLPWHSLSSEPDELSGSPTITANICGNSGERANRWYLYESLTPTARERRAWQDLLCVLVVLLVRALQSFFFVLFAFKIGRCRSVFGRYVTMQGVTTSDLRGSRCLFAHPGLDNDRAYYSTRDERRELPITHVSLLSLRALLPLVTPLYRPAGLSPSRGYTDTLCSITDIA